MQLAPPVPSSPYRAWGVGGRSGGRRTASKRLLVVEDAPKMSSLLQRAFREDGYAVDVQASGHGAVWMGCECDFDAVILDIGLPDIDGFDVCRQLRERGRRMPILMLTAREAVPDLGHGLDAGADGSLTKPFQIARL